MRVFRIGIAVAAVALTGCAQEARVTPAPAADSAPYTPFTHAAAFDAYLEEAVRYDHFIGTVLVARDGNPVFERSYGQASYELDVANTAETVFSIASITKQFTAAAILQLRDQNLLKLDDPICDHLDDCPAAWQSVTIRHLLTHSSGIPNYSSLPDWDERLAGLSYRRRSDLIALVRDLPLQFPPGSSARYSNTGYQLLGLIIEQTSDMRYGDYLQQHILTPAGMRQTIFNNSRALVPGLAAGYYSLGTTFVRPYVQSPTVYFGDAGLFTTAGDLLRWDRALSSDRVLSRQSIDEMFTPTPQGYGLGWRVGEQFGRRQANHSGSGVGFSSYILRFLDEHLAVIVLSNSDEANASRVGNSLAAIYFGEPHQRPQASLADILWDVIEAQDAAAGIERYLTLKATQPSAYDFDNDGTLVDLGYDFYEAGELAVASQIFEFALSLFPRSAYSHDGLADIALEQERPATAIRHFEASLLLEPGNEYAIRGLARARRAQ